MAEKRTNTYNLEDSCIKWLADQAIKLDTSASKILNRIIKKEMNHVKKTKS